MQEQLKAKNQSVDSSTSFDPQKFVPKTEKPKFDANDLYELGGMDVDAFLDNQRPKTKKN